MNKLIIIAAAVASAGLQAGTARAAEDTDPPARN